MVIGVLVWIPVAIWVISVIGWAIMGEAETGFALISICLVVGLALVAAQPPEPWMSYASGGALLVLSIFYPGFRIAMTKRAMFQIDLERLERLHEQVRLRPNDLSAQFKIAEAYYNHGFHGHGYALANSILPSLPASLYHEEHMMLKRWSQDWRGNIPQRSVPCLKCGHYNGPGGFKCSKCGAEYLFVAIRGVFRESGLFWRLAYLGFFGMVVGVGIPIVASLKVPQFVNLGLIFALSGFALYLLFRATKGDSA